MYYVLNIICDYLTNYLPIANICNYYNTRIYKLNSVPHIARFLLWDAIILSKTKPCSGRKKQESSAKVKLKTIKQCARSCHLFGFFI